MKKALVIGAGAVVLIAILAFVFASNLDAIVAKAIEKYGSETTQTAVNVSGVDIALREGRGTIRGLNVASPEGYRARTAFALEDITIDIDIKSVREDPIVIEEIRIAGPVVHAELTGTGASNVDDLRKRTQQRAAQARRGDGQAPAKAKRIRIERIVFEEGRIELDASSMPDAITVWLFCAVRKPMFSTTKLKAAAVMTKATNMMAVSRPVIPRRFFTKPFLYILGFSIPTAYSAERRTGSFFT